MPQVLETHGDEMRTYDLSEVYGNWVAELTNVIEQVKHGDTIIVANDARAELAMHALNQKFATQGTTVRPEITVIAKKAK